MEEIELEEETNDIVNFDPIKIKKNNIDYNLNIEAGKHDITFSIWDHEQFPSVNYSITISLQKLKNSFKEIKDIDSVHDIYNYLKKLMRLVK